MSPMTDKAIPTSTQIAIRVAGQPTIQNSKAVVSGLVGTCNQAIWRSADRTASAPTTRTATTGAGTRVMLPAFEPSHQRDQERSNALPVDSGRLIDRRPDPRAAARLRPA